jgi:hypothetical protein
MLYEGSDQGLDEAGIGLRVVVERDQYLPACRTKPGIVAARQTQVAVEGQEAYLRILVCHELLGSIARGIVYEDHLYMPVRLGPKGVQANRQVLDPVPVGDDD